MHNFADSSRPVVNCGDYTQWMAASTDLCELMTSEGSDKGNGWHNYTRIYHAMFGEQRHATFSLFELGMGSTNPEIDSNMGPAGRPGASHRGWASYFPNATIYGADIDPLIVGGPYDTARIESAWVDQADPTAIRSLWDDKFPKQQFDIMIDDGLHEPDANMTFLEYSCDKLSATGVYVIEDILQEDADYLVARLHRFCARKSFEGQMINLPGGGGRDNRLAVLFRC